MSTMTLASSAPRVIAVVCPTYDEQENIEEFVSAVLAEQANLPGDELHVVVADAHSPDRTQAIVQALARTDPGVHLVDVRERGIGMGLRAGFDYALDTLHADVLVEMDADFQHSPADIPRLVHALHDGADLAVGSRFVAGSVNRMPLYRKVLSAGANQLIRVMLGLHGVTEITTSYRAFTRAAYLRLDRGSVPWHEKSFVAVPILLVRMIESGAHATEISMTMHPRARGYSKMIYLRYMRDILWFGVKSCWERLRGPVL
jgi:dolichol-phosphate mannosyltransferase